MCFVGSWFPTLVGTSVQLRHSCCRWSFVTRRRLVQKTSHSRWMAVQQLVQYIIIRKDLIRDLGWPLGSVIAQGVHAAVAVNWKYRDDPLVYEYCSQESHQMHTVVLEATSEAKLLQLAEQLDGAHIQCVVWKEQPENMVTAIAVKPYPKEQVAPFLKHLRLCK